MKEEDNTDEYSSGERQSLDRLPREITPPPDLERRVVDSLASRGLVKSTRPRSRAWPWTAAAAVIAFAVGIGAGYRLSQTPEVTSDNQYLLMLYEDETFDSGSPADSRDRVAEYSRWASTLAREGRLVAGEKLQTSRLVLTSQGEGRGSWNPQVEGGDVAGYFVIAAPDDDAVLEIAKTCPHLRYGGRIVIRGIERFSR